MNEDTRSLKQAVEYMRDTLGDSVEERRKAEREALIKKWAWFLGEGTKERPLKPVDTKLWGFMAMMFQNEIEANRQPKSFYEATQASDVSLPHTWTLPIIRQIFAEMIMNKICLVQPMPPSSAGTMNLFWLKFYREDEGDSQTTTPSSVYATPANEETSTPKRINAAVTTETASATMDTLMTTWSQKVYEDALGALGLNVEEESMNELAGEIMRELEQRVIVNIYNGATAGTATWTWTNGTTLSDTDYYQGLFHAFIDAEQYVRAARYRECEYIVAGSTVLTYMDKANWFGGLQRKPGAGPYTSAVKFEGTYRRWDIYSSPYMTATAAFMSYYPQGMLHGGYIWSPYIPLMPMPRIPANVAAYNAANPGMMTLDDNWTRKVRTRNAQYYCAPDMFAKVTISAS